ncbi:uncharacterized protein LOC108138070 [Drosophila elegans]|uniref:uncharacterized protein LOC108138070 n=1 Tax=Drosophila elegans TaxID=30023 RepID=UPI0007E8B0A3|nr:uncharacterized protein LOC108138070 [Drosophila elegans]
MFLHYRSLKRFVKHIVGDDDEFEETLNSEQEKNENSNKEKIDMDGSNCITNVTQTARGPPILVLGKAAAVYTVRARLTQPYSLAFPNRGAYFPPQESMGVRISKRSRSHMGFVNAVQPATVAPTVAPSAQLAKPLDVTAYFHQLSADLIQQRVCQEPFLALCKRIDSLVAQSLN